MVLRGPTLTLRLPTDEDAPALLALASDPEVTKWFSWGPYASIEEPLRYVARCAEQRKAGEQLDFVMTHRTAGPVGITGLSEFSLRNRHCMVGTWFGRAYWGTGMNRESKAILAHLAFAVLGQHRLGSYSNPANVRSTTALQRVGFVHEGVLRGWHRHGDVFHDVNVFGMLREEWERGPLRAEFTVEVDGEPPPALLPEPRATPAADPS